MPIVCVNRPNRTIKRRFTPRDLGRIACYVKRDGATIKEMRAELEKCMPELCARDGIEDAIQALIDLAAEIALRRFGSALQILRRLLSRFAVGRNLLNALDDFFAEAIRQIENVIGQLRRL